MALRDLPSEADVRRRLEEALEEVRQGDRHLLENDLSERCIASRLAMYLQKRFHFDVDVEYNRAGDTPKKLFLPDECANYVDEEGRAFVVPDVIVHRRGPEGPNILVVELKKTTNPEPRKYDHMRLAAFREQLQYSFGAFVELETRPRHEVGIRDFQWFGEARRTE